MKCTVRFLARLALAASLVLGCGEVARAQDKVVWVRDPTVAEPGGRTGTRVPCGSYGVFHFNLEGAPSLAPAPTPILHAADLCKYPFEDCESGEEIPPFYPSKGVGGIPPIQPVPVPPSSSRSPEGEAGKRRGVGRGKAAWSPCASGTCFQAKSLVTAPTRPWVAVVDWDDPHGWSVGWTIRELAGSGFDLVLLPFFTVDLQAFSAKGVTDVHTLAKLCEISEAVDRSVNPAPPPAAINLSFGRYARPGVDLDRGSLCQSDLLSCQIVRVLEHLYRPPTAPGTGTVVVAAAGNYRSLQFPATAQTVLPAGALDVDAFMAQRATATTWETAPELAGSGRSRSLLPASGLCLEATPGQLTSASWVAPPGTSYSSALLSGWLAVELRSTSGPTFDPLLPELWSLGRTCLVGGGCTYTLRQGSLRSFGPHPSSDLLFGRLFDSRGRECGLPATAGAPTIEVGVAPNAETVDPTAGKKSFLQILAGWEIPSPEEHPCIPCAGSHQPPPKRVGIDLALASPAPGPTPTPVGGVDAVPLDWTIDFSEQGGFGEAALLDAIYLRSESGFRQVQLTPNDLAVVQSGKLNGVYLRGAGSYVSGSKQASLVFLMTWSGDSEKFWSSVPVYFP